MVVLGGAVVSYEQGIPVGLHKIDLKLGASRQGFQVRNLSRRLESRQGLIGKAEQTETEPDLIAASIYDEYSIGPSIRPICTTRYFTITNVVQACSNFY